MHKIQNVGVFQWSYGLALKFLIKDVQNVVQLHIEINYMFFPADKPLPNIIQYTKQKGRTHFNV